MESKIPESPHIVPASIMLAGAIIAGALVYDIPRENLVERNPAVTDAVVLGVTLDNLLERLKETGVIDEEKWAMLYPAEQAVTDGEGRLVVTQENAGYLLNLLWALGLGNKNEVLEEGPMVDPRYGGPQNFASTGGWSIAHGHAMDHYSAHELLRLGDTEQDMVERVAKSIYRPCCLNSAYFPDCNHGMAMLGLLELLASQGMGEEEMTRTAHLVNSYWFPEFYEKRKNNISNPGCSVS